MKLIDYISKHYNGNKSAFGHANAYSRAQVGQMVSKGIYHVYDGMLVISRRELKQPATAIKGE